MNEFNKKRPLWIAAIWDIVPAALAILVLIASLMWRSQFTRPAGRGKYAVVTQNGHYVMAVPLHEDTGEYDIDIGYGYNAALRVDNGSIRFIRSNCRDRQCVRSGAIRRAGQTSVCLTSRVAVRIVYGADEIDAVTG